MCTNPCLTVFLWGIHMWTSNSCILGQKRIFQGIAHLLW
jgi:hypothetical protein